MEVLPFILGSEVVVVVVVVDDGFFVVNLCL